MVIHNPLTKIAVITGVWMFFILAVISFTYTMFPVKTESVKKNFFYESGINPFQISLSTWDAQWFIAIAENGYQPNPQVKNDKTAYAYFPLYPLLVHAAALVTQNTILGGLLINVVATILGSIYLFKLTTKLSDQKRGYETVFFWLLNPAIIFFISVYSESLFFCLTTAALYYWVCSRYRLSIMLALLSVFSRFQGVILILPMAVYTLIGTDKIGELIHVRIQKKHFVTLTPLLLLPLGLGLLYGWGVMMTHSFNFYQSIQADFARSPISLSALMDIGARIQHFTELPNHGFMFSKLDLLYVAAYLGLCLYQLKSGEGFLSSYSLIMGLAPLLTGNTMSLIRLLSVNPGFYIALSQLCSRRPLLRQVLYAAFVFLASLFALLHTHWYWVA